MPLPPQPKKRPLKKSADSHVAGLSVQHGDTDINPAALANRLSDAFFDHVCRECDAGTLDPVLADQAKGIFNAEMYKLPRGRFTGGEYLGGASPGRAAKPSDPLPPVPTRINSPENLLEIMKRFDRAGTEIEKMMSHWNIMNNEKHYPTAGKARVTEALAKTREMLYSAMSAEFTKSISR